MQFYFEINLKKDNQLICSPSEGCMIFFSPIHKTHPTNSLETILNGNCQQMRSECVNWIYIDVAVIQLGLNNTSSLLITSNYIFGRYWMRTFNQWDCNDLHFIIFYHFYILSILRWIDNKISPYWKISTEKLCDTYQITLHMQVIFKRKQPHW